MPLDDDDVTSGELRRNIQDVRADTQRALNQVERTLEKLLENMEKLPYLRADVYKSDQVSRGERIGRIEQDVAQFKSTLAKINFTAWTAIVLPIAVAIFVAVILAAVNIK